ncbi:protein charybde-like [Schistocerca americana]|uniref:protein charybde-like n=1 Tax=Schistocerca americana TaxID=7009 RepID=UPI001F4F9C3C|nr:protein charybde-like [Schistocerca americana]XP_049947256.1 protein charybde-like isoform X1 [Schistocerca serialis cubense]
MNGNMERVLEDTQNRPSKLQEVFSKISDIWHQSSRSKEVFSSEVIESVLPERFNIPINGVGNREYDGESEEEISALAHKLEKELRIGKQRSLPSEIRFLLPEDLLKCISRDILAMADSEPCGLRGCTMFLNFEGENECRRLRSFKYDDSTVSTFELFLMLKQDKNTWNSILPEFLKRMTRSNTVVISRAYTLKKKKLYRSYNE